MKCLFLAILLVSTTAIAAPPPTPFNYSRSSITRNQTTYYQRNGAIAGRSYGSGKSTYWYNSNGSSAGRSFKTPSGNTYFYGK